MHEHPSGQTGDRDDTLSDLLADYVEQIVEGKPPDRAEIVAEHPSLAEEILACLEDFTHIVPEDIPPPQVGRLGDYTLERQIGRGGMGVVYSAWENSLERRVALKLLPAGCAADDRAFQRFVREARAAGQLHHPNIVGVHGMGVSEETPYYAMEYVHGETLAQIIGRRKSVVAGSQPSASAPEEAPPSSPLFTAQPGGEDYFRGLAAAFAETAHGLHHAHSKGVVHRDLKPANVIADGQGRLRLLDFGLARLEGQEALTQTGDIVGTPAYMSPEQVRRPKTAVDHRTDIYSLGATMHEVLTGEPLFRGKDHRDTMNQVIDRDPPEPRKLNPAIPVDFETTILKCLRKEPSERYGTAEALAQDLMRLARGDAIEAKPLSAWSRLIRRTRKNRGKLLIALGAGLLAITTALLVDNFRRERHRETERVHLAKIASYEEKVLGAVLQMATGKPVRGQQQGRRSKSPAPSSSRGSEHQGDTYATRHEAPVPHPAEAAVASLREAISLFPERPVGHYHLARALVALGREEEALAELSLATSRGEYFAPAVTLQQSLADNTSVREPEVKSAAGAEATETGRMPTAWENAWHVAHTAERASRWKQAAEAYGVLIDFEQSGAEPYLGASIETRLGRGTAYLRAGVFPKALADFAAAEGRWPQSIEPSMLLGKTFHSMGEKRLAQEKFEQLYARTREEFRTRTALSVADFLGMARDAKRARRWAERARAVATEERDLVSAFRLLGLLASAEKNFAEAARMVGYALELHPESHRLHEDLGAALGEQNRLEEALQAFQTASRLDPECALAHHNLGTILRDLGRVDEAITEYEQAVRLEPTHLTYEYLGAIRAQRGEFDKAVVALRRAREMEPECPTILSQLTEALARANQLDEAIAEYRAALTKTPHHKGYEELGRFLAHEKRLPEALASFRRASDLSPHRGEAYDLAAQVLWSMRKPEQALGELRAATDVEPENATWRFNLGLAFARLGRFADGAREYKRGLTYDPESASGHHQLGLLDAQQGQLEAALVSLERAVALDGSHHGYCKTLGAALRAHGQLERAVAIYGKAIELDPACIEARTSLGQLLNRQGKLPRALEEYEKLCALYEKKLAAEPENRELEHEYVHELRPVVELAERLNRPDLVEKLSRRELELMRRSVDVPRPTAHHLNDYAWALLETPVIELRDPAAALRLARQAVELTRGENFGILDTLALAQFRNGHVQEAVATQRSVIAKLPPARPGENDPVRTEVEGRLREFEAALEQSATRAPR